MTLLIKDPDQLDYFDLQPQYATSFKVVREITNEIYNASGIYIRMLAMDFKDGDTPAYRKQLAIKWKEILPDLQQVTALKVRYLADNDFLAAVCKMKNLEYLSFETSNISDLSALSNLQKLRKLELRSSKLEDISPLLALKNLEALSVSASFKVNNYEIIGQLRKLKALQLKGDVFAPKTLKLKSLLPFTSLTELEQLDITSSSVTDKSFMAVTQLPKLQRLDMVTGVNQKIADEIKNSCKNIIKGSLKELNFKSRVIITKVFEDEKSGITKYTIEPNLTK